MNFHLQKQQLYSLLTVLGLLIALILGLTLVKQSQEIRKRAAGSAATLAVYPIKEHFESRETKIFELKVTFSGGSAAEKLDYFKTTVSFSNKYLLIPSDKYVDVSESGFDKVFRVDGPQAGNETGKVIIEVGAKSPGSGPPTDKPLTLAKIYFSGKAQTPSPQDITIGSTQAVNNQSAAIPVTVQGAKYEVGGSSPTESLSPTGSLSCSLKNKGDANCDGVVNDADYALWEEEYDNMVAPLPLNKNANFSCIEGNSNTYWVDMVDFEKWRRNTANFSEISPTPSAVVLTITIQPTQSGSIP